MTTLVGQRSDLATPAIDETAVQAFITGVRGTVIRPGDVDYDETRAVHNGLIDRRPALMVRCNGTADVVEAVNFARTNNVLVSVRGGGHNVAGNAVNDGGIVIDLSLMRGVHVDPMSRTVRVQGGATWGDVDRETQLFGLATPGGLVSTTGVAGLTLHGGFGWLRRKYGYSVDNLLSVEIVNADGQVRTASATENADLFWAVRGAGSNFGVVTSLEFRLHPVGPMVTLAAPFYALEDAPSVLPAWRDFTEAAPDEITGEALFWSIPAVEAFPAEMHGRPVVMPTAVHCGPPDVGERVLQPLRELATPLLDLSGPMPYTVLQSAFDTFFPTGGLYYWKSLYLDRLDDEVISELIASSSDRPTPSTIIDLWQLGGAVSRVGAEETAFGRSNSPYLLSFLTTWHDPADTDRSIAWTRENWAAMQRFGPGGLYLNLAGFGEEKDALVQAGYGANYERLGALKAKYDPTNLFRMNQNIKPAR